MRETYPNHPFAGGKGVVAASQGILPPALVGSLTARGFQVQLVDLSRSAPPAPSEPQVTVLASSELPGDPELAQNALARFDSHRCAVIVVGDAPPTVAETVSSLVHAWLPSPVQEIPLVTAIRSAFATLAGRRELAWTQEQVSLKDAEARSLYEIGTALSAERDITRLQDLILRRCRELTKADAGSLYIVGEDAEKRRILRFDIAQNDSIAASYQRATMPLTEQSIAGYVALTGRPVNLADAYEIPPEEPYSHNRAFDQRMGYRTKSMLVVPLRNYEGDIVGVIQLINHKPSSDAILTTPDVAERLVGPFPPEAEQVLESFASQAAVALDNRLLLENIEQLFEGFVRASVTAIESRDPTTSGHSERVANVTVGIALAVNGIQVGRWNAVHFSPEQIREIRYAGLLHDFGKIGVREHVLLKAKKLFEGQLELVRMRFAFVQKALEADFKGRQLALLLERGRDAYLQSLGPAEASFRDRLKVLDEDLAAIVSANEPTVLAQESAARLLDLANERYLGIDGSERPLLDPGELLALSVRRGSLTEEERREIESHVSHTYQFLSVMPWTRTLRDVPTIAWKHHEKLDGSGYPQGLPANDIPIQSRMMTIADIYDALTAADRPYKKAVPLERALDILSEEVRSGYLDAELFDVFLSKRVYETTAKLSASEQLSPAVPAFTR